MDAESFERVYDSLQEFHAFFAASFARKQWREHSGNYLQALLVQDQERRNAENLSESVGISARAMQRFLTEARWSDETVIGRLQEYLAPRLGHPEAVWVFDGSDFPKQGRKSAGVARQYCGRLGKVANCQGGMFLAYVSPLGRALVDKAAVSARELDLRPGPLCGGGCARGAAELPVEDGVGLGTVGASLGVGPPQGPDGLRETTPSGCPRPSGRGWWPWGCATSWTYLRALRCGRWSRRGPLRSIGDGVVPPSPGSWPGSGGPWGSAALNCRRRLGGRLRWPREARGPAAMSSAPSGCVQPAGVSPTTSTGPSTAGTSTAANPLLPVQRTGGYSPGDSGLRGRFQVAH